MGSSLSIRDKLNSGVPQWSVIGLVLFLIYLRNLANALINPYYKFVDGVKIIGSIDARTIQRDPDEVHK